MFVKFAIFHKLYFALTFSVNNTEVIVEKLQKKKFLYIKYVKTCEIIFIKYVNFYMYF